MIQGFPCFFVLFFIFLQTLKKGSKTPNLVAKLVAKWSLKNPVFSPFGIFEKCTFFMAGKCGKVKINIYNH